MKREEALFAPVLEQKWAEQLKSGPQQYKVASKFSRHNAFHKRGYQSLLANLFNVVTIYTLPLPHLKCFTLVSVRSSALILNALG